MCVFERERERERDCVTVCVCECSIYLTRGQNNIYREEKTKENI